MEFMFHFDRFPSDPYAGISDLYDLEHADFADDIDLYLNLALSTGDPILELGSGSGRLVVPLAEAGHRVTAVDRSPAMMERARKAVAEHGLGDRVTFHPGEMVDADLAPGGPFGLAIVALNGLLHLITQEEQRRTLAAIRRSLDPRGQLVLDLFNPSPDALRALDHSASHDGSWTREGGTRVDKFAARRVHPGRQILATDLWYDTIGLSGDLRRTATSYEMRYLHRSEMDLLLELAGFEEVSVYGSYDLDPFEDPSERIIVTAEVTRGVPRPPEQWPPMSSREPRSSVE